MKRLEITRHTVRCPLEDCPASLTVRTHPGASPGRRHRDVTACSLLSASSFAPPARSGYFPDVAPPVSYLREALPGAHHSPEVSCSKRCLAILNAAELGTAEPVRCTSGVNDALELARQTQSLSMMRVLWSYSA
jgi:hypothetical protein